MKKKNNYIRVILFAVIVTLIASVPIPLKKENIIWHETVRGDDKTDYAYWIQIGGTWCSRVYTDIEIEGSVCNIHVKGALASLSGIFGSKRLPTGEFINDPDKSIQQIYLVCSDGKLLIYDQSHGERYSKDYTEELMNRVN